MKRNVLLLSLVALASCTHRPQNGPMIKAGKWPLLAAPLVQEGGSASLFVGGFSGLCCADARGTHVELISLSDRGPNHDPYFAPGNPRPQRPFVLPTFVPELLLSRWSLEDGWTLGHRIPLSWPDGVAVSGLPNTLEDEAPVDAKGRALPLDPRGLDPEGIALDHEGHYWIVEEYGPSVLKVDSRGRILKRWIPKGSAPARWGQDSLPAELALRSPNRGFEGVALVGQLLYAFLQSPLPNQEGIRVLVWDIGREAVHGGLLEYPLHDPKANKIGDVSALPDGRLLVLEQDGGTTRQALRKVFVWDPASGQKSLLLDLSEAGYYAHEKVEGLAMLDSSHLAVVIDNDYGLKNKSPSELAIFEVKLP
jgi:hypothetical protein